MKPQTFKNKVTAIEKFYGLGQKMKIEKGIQFSIKGNAYKGKVFTCLEVNGDKFRCEDGQGVKYTFTADLLFDHYGVEEPREIKRRIVRAEKSRLDEYNDAPYLAD